MLLHSCTDRSDISDEHRVSVEAKCFLLVVVFSRDFSLISNLLFYLKEEEKGISETFELNEPIGLNSRPQRY